MLLISTCITYQSEFPMLFLTLPDRRRLPQKYGDIFLLGV